MTFEVREYEPSDGPAINDSFNQVFGLQRSLEEWRWKFRPEDGTSRVLIGLSQTGEVLSHFAAFRNRLMIDSVPMNTGMVCDVFCKRSKDTVRNRLYLRTAQKFFQTYGGEHDLPFVFGFPGKRALALGKLALGYQATGIIPTYRRQVPRIQLSLPFRRFRFLSGKQITRRQLDAFWSRACERYRYGAVRDYEWLQRRYLEHPHVEYNLLAVEGEGRMQAWGVLRFDAGRARLVDLCWDGADPRALKALDTESCARTRHRGLKDIYLLLERDTDALKTFRSLGWVEHAAEEMPSFCVLIFDQKYSADELLSNFYLTWGDTDLA